MVTPDPEGGIYHYSHELCRGLAEAGEEVVLVTSAAHEFADLQAAFRIATPFRLGARGILSSPLSRRVGIKRVASGVRYVLALVRTAVICRRERPDVVHVQGLFGSVLGYASLWFLARVCGKPIVNTVHNVAPRRRFIGYRLVGRQTLRVLDAVIVHSHRGHETLRRIYGRLPAVVCVIGTVGLQAFAERADVERTVSLRGWGLGPDARVVLFFGFIKPYKGLDQLLRAFNVVCTRIKNAYLFVVGEPREPFERYQKLIRELGIEQRVVVQLGYVPSSAVARYFGIADVVTLPYVNDEAIDQSAVAQLAYAFSRPLVVTDVGGLSEMVRDGQTGYIVPPGRVNELANRLVDILSDPSRAQEMGRSGHQLVDSLKHSQSTSARHIECYRAAIGRGNAPGEGIGSR